MARGDSGGRALNRRPGCDCGQYWKKLGKRYLPLSLAFATSVFGAEASAQRQEFMFVEHMSVSADRESGSFTRITSAARLSNRSMVLVGPLGPDAVVVDSLGQHVLSLGRAGDGPGEFRRPVQVGFTDGELWIGDLIGGRLTRFDAGFRALSTRPHGTIGVPFLMSGGSVWMLQTPSVDERPAQRSTRIVRHHPAPSGGPMKLDTIFERETGGLSTLPARSPAEDVGEQPFDDGLLVAISNAGVGAIVVDRSVGTEARSSVKLLRLNERGEKSWEVVLPRLLSPPPRGLVEWEIARRVEPRLQREPRPLRSMVESGVRRNLVIPPLAPAISVAFLDASGVAWLRGVSDSRSVAWTRVGADGKLLGDVILPHGATLIWAAGANLCIQQRDEEAASLVRCGALTIRQGAGVIPPEKRGRQKWNALVH